MSTKTRLRDWRYSLSMLNVSSSTKSPDFNPRWVEDPNVKESVRSISGPGMLVQTVVAVVGAAKYSRPVVGKFDFDRAEFEFRDFSVWIQGVGGQNVCSRLAEMKRYEDASRFDAVVRLRCELDRSAST